MNEFYTVNQAAQILKVHPLTIRRYIKEGKLHAYRIEGNVRISINDLKTFTQNFNLDIKPQISQETLAVQPFTIDDPIFQIEGKGNSINQEGS